MPVLRVRVNGRHLDLTRPHDEPDHDSRPTPRYHIPRRKDKLFDIDYGPKYGPVKIYTPEEIKAYLEGR